LRRSSSSSIILRRWVIVDLLMTQPYPFTHTADTGHAKASAAKRLCSNGLRGDLLEADFGITSSESAPKRNCRGRDDHHGSPPAQIRTSASTHTALTKDEWRRSVHRDRGAERGVEESTGSRLG